MAENGILDMPLIKVLGLSTRSRNTLGREGFKSLRDVAEFSERELLVIEGFGKVSFLEIEGALLRQGISLADGETAPASRKERILNDLYIHSELRGNQNGTFKVDSKDLRGLQDLKKEGLVFYTERHLNSRQRYAIGGLTEEGLEHIWRH